MCVLRAAVQEMHNRFGTRAVPVQRPFQQLGMTLADRRTAVGAPQTVRLGGAAAVGTRRLNDATRTSALYTAAWKRVSIGSQRMRCCYV